jgi:DNA-binding transcriptional regulator YhcF (GntR family)
MEDTVARYAQIVADIRARIASGELHTGDRVPSARQITRDWGVAIATATKVHAALQREGLVRSVPGIGTVVAADGHRPRPVRAAEARDPDRELTRDRIVHAAMTIADTESLAALSMRRLATDLGVATMSLYRYVRSKDDLVLQMIDAIFAGAPLPEPPRGWRAQLELVARAQWKLYRRHSWLAHYVSMTRPQLVPSGMIYTERVLAAIDELGFDRATALHAALTLIGFVRGIAVSLEPEQQAQQDTGLTSDEWMAAQDRQLREIFASGRFPMLARLTTGPDIDADLDSLFEFGLRQLLDGLQARVSSVAAGSTTAPARPRPGRVPRRPARTTP